MMNLKTFSVLFLAILLIINTEAKTIDLTQAEKVAKNFIYITANKYDNALNFSDIKLSGPFIHRSGEKPVFYAFQLNPGFVIISAEDAYTPVIGYSFEGSFSLDNAPAHYQLFIKNYINQVNYVREQNIQPSAEIAASWNELTAEGIERALVARERDVDYFLRSTWDQGSPYNIYCPEDDAGPGGHVWVGCVATAMAQIMYYWRYPETGTGSHCYTPGNSSYGQQCANFGQMTYDWAGMINGIDNRNPEANALLQYHCAVAVNMDFGPDGSGSQSYLVPNRLDQYFRYNNAVYEERQDYSYANWVNLLKADIDAGKPMYYSGYTDDWSGHAFVCDGYQGENFHFNFGWSGSSNGYYSLYDVGGFSNWQACVRNFAPSDNNYPYYSTGTKTLTGKSGSITDGSGPVHDYADNTTAYWIIDPQTLHDSISSITLTFSSFDLMSGDSIKVYNGATTSDPLLGTFSGNTLPPALTTTQNRMLIEFKSNGTGNGTGWYAQYTTTSPSWCQGLTPLTEPSGTFDDGSGKFYYQGQSTCMWRISPQFAEKITLSFNFLDTEEGSDKITIFDGTTKIAEISGNEIPDPIEATSGVMFITWTTSPSNNFQGWEAYYEVDNVGLNENENLPELSVYPNPASGTVQVKFFVADKANLELEIINLTGQSVFAKTYAAFNGAYLEEIDISKLPSGVYFIKVYTPEGIVNKKFIVR